ncbi:hypothetical protein AS593_03335 [Caulobacter vibrioides]|nr:hypothetical protein AS593_03335 [Caulobacter vibrioides]
MFRCAAVLSAVALAGAGLVTSASAATFTPNPVTGFTMSGTVTISRPYTGTSVCNISLTGDIAGGGASGVITSGSMSGGSATCGAFLRPNNFPWPLVPNSTTSATMDMGFIGLLSACYGTANVAWANGAPSSITFSSTFFPGGEDCYVTGTLSVSNSLTIM